MNNNIIFLLLIFQLFCFSFHQECGASLQISRSKSHEDQTNSLTPLVVKLSSMDKSEKTKGVDLICVVDVSGSMSGSRISLVKESLKYLTKLMDNRDRLAIVAFTDSASVKLHLTDMTEANKETAIKVINGLRAYGGTDIITGLRKGLDLITDNYNSGQRVASIVLLSDGYDGGRNADINFRNYIKNQNKQTYTFTLHTLGYGESHDANLMSKISLIRDGGYFFIRYLSQEVNSAILEIYGSLSTNCQVDVGLSLTSNYTINKVMGMEDMYERTLISDKPSSFSTKIIHFVYGKSYDFIVLVDIPEDTPKGEVVLTANVTLFDLEAKYRWDNSLDPYAYEEYIRGISCKFFQSAYDEGKTKGLSVMNSANAWIANYDGIRDWKKEYEDVVNDLNNFDSYGRANLASKLRELKSSKPGVHYNDENSYQRKIMDDFLILTSLVGKIFK